MAYNRIVAGASREDCKHNAICSDYMASLLNIYVLAERCQVS